MPVGKAWGAHGRAEEEEEIGDISGGGGRPKPSAPGASYSHSFCFFPALSTMSNGPKTATVHCIPVLKVASNSSCLCVSCPYRAA